MTHRRLTDADLLTQLQASARQIDGEVEMASRNLRSLKTEFGRREAQRARKAKLGDMTNVEALKIEVETLRAKNEDFRNKLAGEHQKLVNLIAKETELRKAGKETAEVVGVSESAELRAQLRHLKDERENQENDMRRRIKEEAERIMRLEIELAKTKLQPPPRQFVQSDHPQKMN